MKLIVIDIQVNAVSCTNNIISIIKPDYPLQQKLAAERNHNLFITQYNFIIYNFFYPSFVYIRSNVTVDGWIDDMVSKDSRGKQILLVSDPRGYPADDLRTFFTPVRPFVVPASPASRVSPLRSSRWLAVLGSSNPTMYISVIVELNASAVRNLSNCMK